MDMAPGTNPFSTALTGVPSYRFDLGKSISERFVEVNSVTSWFHYEFIDIFSFGSDGFWPPLNLVISNQITYGAELEIVLLLNPHLTNTILNIATQSGELLFDVLRRLIEALTASVVLNRFGLVEMVNSQINKIIDYLSF
jgi:hypothetical protein